MLSAMVAPDMLGVGVDAGVEPGRELLSAASRLNGSAKAEVELNDGGLTRENGAEVRRVDFNPARFLCGDLPAGAVIGARGEDMFARKGV